MTENLILNAIFLAIILICLILIFKIAIRIAKFLNFYKPPSKYGYRR